MLALAPTRASAASLAPYWAATCKAVRPTLSTTQGQVTATHLLLRSCLDHCHVSTICTPIFLFCRSFLFDHKRDLPQSRRTMQPMQCRWHRGQCGGVMELCRCSSTLLPWPCMPQAYSRSPLQACCTVSRHAAETTKSHPTGAHAMTHVVAYCQSGYPIPS